MKHLHLFATTLLALALLGTTPADLRAATITVTSPADSGAGTLRAALASAANGDKINFSLPTPATIKLTSGELVVAGNVSIIGPGAVGLAINGNAASRVFRIAPSVTVTIAGLTITNGPNSGIFNEGSSLIVSNCAISGNLGSGIYSYASSGSVNVTILNSTVSGNSAGFGGGICNLAQGGSVSLTIRNSTLADNSANFAGGIWNVAQGGSASATILNSTLSGNSASYAGGIWNEAEGGGSIANLEIANSTLSDNSASSTGGGIWNYFDTGGSATVKIGSTILNAGASGGNIANEPGTTLISDGYNLSSDNGAGVLTGTTDQINTDPMLGPLQDNGGPSFTHALLAGSPAIDRGTNFSAFVTDQRGAGFVRASDDPRVANAAGGDGTDIGAFEVQTYIGDTTPPNITCPADQAVPATSDAGAVVNYVAPTVTDDDPVVTTACSPPAGSTFAIGTTTVTCTAMDSSGNQSRCSFTVRVKGAPEQITDLIAAVQSFNFKPRTASRLIVRLQRASSLLSEAHARNACLKLRRFMTLTNARTLRKQISAAQAAQMTADATRIRTLLNCQ